MGAKRPEKDRSTDSMRPHFADLARLSVSLRIGSYRADMIYWGIIAPRWWRNWLHAHSFFEICYAYRGRGTFRVLGQERRVQAGDLFIARPREHHEVISSRVSPLGIYFWAFTLAPTSSRALGPADDATDALLAALLRENEAVARVGRSYERTLLLLAEEASVAEAGFRHAIDALTVKLIVDTARAVIDTSQIARTPAPPAQNAAADPTQIVLRYLHDNYAQRTEVRDVASQVHLSERHVSRLFRQATGMSILEYLTRLRIDTACKLLREDDLSIKQVARAVGYPDAHYFTTLFGRWVGMTPAAYRRSGGSSAPVQVGREGSSPR